MSDLYPSSVAGHDLDDARSIADDLEQDENRYAVFMPAVASLVAALGGYEDVQTADGMETVYRPGDSVLAVLKDLKKLWRKDDADDERTVARCMARAGLMKELIALVGECTPRGDWGRKIALMACDLMAALTWPIDVAQELREMQDEGDVVTDYASLLYAQVEYKASFVLLCGMSSSCQAMIIHSDTLRSILSLILPYLAKPRREQREERIVSLGLHIVRNLLAIKDVVSDGSAVGEKEELSTLQSSLVLQLDKLTYFQLILTMASAADKTAFNPFNVLALDILHLTFRGVSVHDLGQDQARAPIENLTKLLDAEMRRKATASRNGMSRHSRFGTTITVKAGDQKVILHKQNAISANAAKVLDEVKRKRAGKHKRHDELTVPTNLSPDAIVVLQRLAKLFIQSCFNTFIASILKDIRMERAKVRPKDSVRALFVARFCIEYLLVLRAKAAKAGKDANEDLALGLVAEMAEVDSVRWVVLRMKLTMDDKPPAWTELQASIDCFTQILLLIDAMSVSKDEEEVEVAEILQNQLYYNGDILDSCLSVVTQYKDQSIGWVLEVFVC
ncbi:Topoisomerase 1-associated factor 1 [Cryptotrichosporon argae]